MLNETITKEFNLNINQILEEDKQLMFGNFLEPHSIEKQYQEITDSNQLIRVVEEYIDEVNALWKNKINIVLFQDAL